MKIKDFRKGDRVRIFNEHYGRVIEGGTMVTLDEYNTDGFFLGRFKRPSYQLSHADNFLSRKIRRLLYALDRML